MYSEISLLFMDPVINAWDIIMLRMQIWPPDRYGSRKYAGQVYSNKEPRVLNE